MNSKNPEPLEMFSRHWYDEYFKRAASSPTHAEFCRQVYGKNLCQHGLMDMNELDFLVSLIAPGTKILEIGCANGYITEYIHERTKSEILALDYSKVAIAQAQARTQAKAKTLQFMQIDLTKEEIPGNVYDYIILIDAIYFLGDFPETVTKLSKKLAETGKMIITYFEIQDEADERNLLPGPDSTYLAKALQQLGAPYQWVDFTENVRAHSLKNYQVGEALKAAFAGEGNQFLYEARAAENRFFKESAEKKTIVRYMYVVNPFQTA